MLELQVFLTVASLLWASGLLVKGLTTEPCFQSLARVLAGGGSSLFIQGTKGHSRSKEQIGHKIQGENIKHQISKLLVV